MGVSWQHVGMKLMQTLFLILIGIALQACAAAGDALSPTAPADATIGFENVRIRTHTESGVIASGHVIVEGEEIVSVGDGPLSEGFDGARIDGGGATLMPGLMDMHVHYYEDGIAPAYLANGITTVRNLTGSAWSVVRDRLAREGELVGPRVVTSGPIINSGKPFPNDFFIRVYTPEQARGAVRSQARSGFRAVKLYDQLDRETFTAAVEEARAQGMKVYTHVPDTLTLEEVLAIGVDTVEHMDGFSDALAEDGYMPADDTSRAEKWSHTDRSRYAALAERLADSGTWTVPTLAITVGRMTSADPDAYFARPEAAILPTWAQTWRRSATSFAELQAFYPVQLREKQAMIRALVEADANLLIGTDGPNPFVTPGYAIHDELRGFVEAGLDVEAVLRIATVDAARFLGMEGRLGVVQNGARADLVLTREDPAADLATLADPIGVMVSGNWHTRQEIEDALEARRLTMQGG